MKLIIGPLAYSVSPPNRKHERKKFPQAIDQRFNSGQLPFGFQSLRILCLPLGATVLRLESQNKLRLSAQGREVDEAVEIVGDLSGGRGKGCRRQPSHARFGDLVDSKPSKPK